MSSYMYFYIRKNKDFMPIGDFSRSTKIYERFSYFAPYEKIRALTREELMYISGEIDYDIKQCRKSKQSEKDFIGNICSFNNDISEKIEAIETTRNIILEIDEDIESLEIAKHYVNMLMGIIESVKYDENFDENNYLYVGKECDPKGLEDIA